MWKEQLQAVFARISHWRVCKVQGRQNFLSHHLRNKQKSSHSLYISLVYVCEIYQYSIGLFSKLILLVFVMCLKQGGEVWI